jgi:hypothetical protein
VLQRFVAIFVFFFASGSVAQEFAFVLVNGTQYQIRALHLSSANMNNYGPNVLQSPYLKPGEARRVDFRGYVVDCNVDLKVVFASIDTQPVWQYLNLCNLKRIKLQYDQMSGVPTAAYDD